MKLSLIEALALIALLPSSAAAATCTVRVLVDIPADNSSGNPYRDHEAFRRGATDEAQYYEHGSFGAEGGDIVPRYIRIRGKVVEAARLSDCVILKNGQLSPIDPHTRAIDLVEDRIYKRIQGDADKFPDVGNAQSGTIAYIYARQPDGPCARLVDQALAGDRRAVATLNSIPAYCSQP
jgi:hypothetical protein